MTEYIERQAAIKKLDHFQSHLHTVEGTGAIGVAKTLIKEIPAAVVRPVVRGRWKQTGGKYSRHKTIDRRILTCSVCGNILYMEGVNAGRGDANFCPNCGADMREEEQDGGL